MDWALVTPGELLASLQEVSRHPADLTDFVNGYAAPPEVVWSVRTSIAGGLEVWPNNNSTFSQLDPFV